MPQDWKDKYVAGYVAVAAPLGGAAKLFRLYVSGECWSHLTNVIYMISLHACIFSTSFLALRLLLLHYCLVVL